MLGTIVKTVDAGRHWTLCNAGNIWNFNALSVVDANNVYVVGNDGIVLKTTDGGQTWKSDVDRHRGGWRRSPQPVISEASPL